FKHAPLDHSKAAIRLVQLLPDLSPEGLIQCTITHHTTDAEYTCLSYRWGAAASISAIRMNGEGFYVRQNLLAFLHMARQNPNALCTYWIDALCIDQTDAAEKVHQVAQMGDIYSKAIQVYVWLGANPDLAPVLENLRKLRLPPFDGRRLDVVLRNRNALESYFCGNEYWERAWIIQEILLARAVVVWADKVPLRFEDLHWNFGFLLFSWKDKSIAHFFLRKGSSETPELHASKFSEFKAHFQGIDLISLLQQFPDKICEVPRDRIFSLLAMSKFGYRIDVDYSVP
ncbi:heterokaryon incompatibility protein-domain-containing protein, partial [Paraphoma chrysanthemicola]